MSVHSPQGAPPPPPPGPPPGYPGPPTAKKGLGPLAWVGIGCGVLLVLAVIAFVATGMFVKKKIDQFAENPEMAAAEAIVAANPDFEKVSSDPEAKTITVRNKQTGEEVTLNLGDIREGRFEVTDKEGNVSSIGVTAGTGDRPTWLPAYPGGTDTGTFAANTPEGKSGGYTVSTGDSVDQVLGFYESKLREAGIEVSKTSSSASDGSVSGGTLSGTTPDDKRTVGIMVGTSDGQTQAIVTYSEKP